jgi:hypothetical protein
LESYVVHIYRCEIEHRLASGLAERVSDGARQGFRTVDELWTFLLATAQPGSSPSPPSPKEKDP